MIDLARSEPGATRRALALDEASELAALSALSAAEYLLGVHLRYRRSKDTLQEKLAQARDHLARFQIIPFTGEVAEVSSAVDAGLTETGARLGLNDLYIAATAIKYGLTLVTRNPRDFGRVPELKVETY